MSSAQCFVKNSSAALLLAPQHNNQGLQCQTCKLQRTGVCVSMQSSCRPASTSACKIATQPKNPNKYQDPPCNYLLSKHGPT